MSFVKVYGHVV